MNHAQKVREFYDKAVHCYQSIMGDTWHHGDPEAEQRGASVLEAAQALEEKVIAAAQLAPGSFAIDFGAGVGGPTVYMAKRSGATLVGLSNNDGLSQRARALAQEAGIAESVCFITTGDDDYKTLLPFVSGSVDAVIFYESVCHLPDKAAFFRAASRVLRPRGRLVGIDWLQRPFGEYQTDAQIAAIMQPVNELICIPWHGSLASYRALISDAGLEVTMARDLFEGVPCWGSTPPDERPKWLGYDGPAGEQFRRAKVALDAARGSGVFTVGMFVAVKP
jgi:tocopherol O-methyltransferase